jgi:hypothetical protein
MVRFGHRNSNPIPSPRSTLGRFSTSSVHDDSYHAEVSPDDPGFRIPINAGSGLIAVSPFHECLHATRGIQLGGVLENLTTVLCVVSGLRSIDDYLQYKAAGLCAEFMLGVREKLSPDADVYQAALAAVEWGERQPDHDLHDFFDVARKARPSLSDDQLMLLADLEISKCHQALRDPLYHRGIHRCARMLSIRGSLDANEFCDLMMMDDS